MLTNEELNEIRQRRYNAYVAMLEECYQVDSAGLAELLEMPVEEWEAERNRPWGEVMSTTFIKLAKLVDHPMRFLFAEDLEMKENGKVYTNIARENEWREQYNLMEYTINHGRDVMTLCSETLLDFAMKMTPEFKPEQKDINVIFGLHDVCGLEAKYFDDVLETA